MPPAGIWLNGLTQSCIYMTMAFGMVLVFSILEVLNWAHGQFYMLGAIIVYYAVSAMGFPFPVSILISGVVIGLMGMLVQKFIVERLNVPGYGPLYVTAATMSLIFFFEGAATILFGMQDRGLSNVMPGVFDVFSLSISRQKVAVIVFTLVVMAIMYFVLNRTKMGLAIRAVAQQPVAANLYGISVKKTSIIVMGIGCALAAMSGGIMAPIYPINPFMGLSPMLMSLLAIVIGGVGSLAGAIAGGIILGFLNSVIAYYMSYFSEVVLFGLVIFILLVRPQGLFGASLK
jgi:branched-chain amino acid transport system permease protein